MLKRFVRSLRRSASASPDDGALDRLLADYEVPASEARFQRMLAAVEARLEAPPAQAWADLFGVWSLPRGSLALGGLAAVVACGLWIGLSLSLDRLPSDAAWTQVAFNLDTGAS